MPWAPAFPCTVALSRNRSFCSRAGSWRKVRQGLHSSSRSSQSASKTTDLNTVDTCQSFTGRADCPRHQISGYLPITENVKEEREQCAGWDLRRANKTTAVPPPSAPCVQLTASTFPMDWTPNAQDKTHHKQLFPTLTAPHFAPFATSAVSTRRGPCPQSHPRDALTWDFLGLFSRAQPYQLLGQRSGHGP